MAGDRFRGSGLKMGIGADWRQSLQGRKKSGVARVKHDSRRHPSVVLFPVDRQSPQESPNVLHRFEAMARGTPRAVERLLRLGLAFAFGTGTVLGMSLSQLHRIGKPPWVQNVMGSTSGRGWRTVHTVQPRMEWGLQSGDARWRRA